MARSFSDQLDAHAKNASLADGTPCRVIPATAIRCLSEESGMAGRLVEITALNRSIIPERYIRNRKTLSEKDQRRLLESAVCIVGLGGLGGGVAETLARMGVGQLHLVDGDTFEAHNLNRQIFSTEDGIGTYKVDAAAFRLKQTNPSVEVFTHRLHLTADNADSLIDQCHLVVDCLDNLPSRFIVQAAARRIGIPMVSAAVAGICGHVTTIFPEDQGLESFYGPESQLSGDKGVETELGCLAPGVNLIASLECSEVCKVLLGKAEPLRRRLLLVDLTDYTFETLSLTPMG